MPHWDVREGISPRQYTGGTSTIVSTCSFMQSSIFFFAVSPLAHSTHSHQTLLTRITPLPGRALTLWS